MKWSLNELRQTVDEPLTFSETLDLKDELMTRNSDIIDVSPVEVKGIFSVDELGVCGYVKVKTKLVLPSSRSLNMICRVLKILMLSWFCQMIFWILIMRFVTIFCCKFLCRF